MIKTHLKMAIYQFYVSIIPLLFRILIVKTKHHEKFQIPFFDSWMYISN